ncbi:uncharacterized protein YgiB involved in biofilm formation [Chitinophaga sp. OAE865]
MLFHDSDNENDPLSSNKYTGKKMENGREYGLAKTGKQNSVKRKGPSCKPLTKSINSREGPTVRIFQPPGLLLEICVQ